MLKNTLNMPKTLFDKIWDKHVIEEIEEGNYDGHSDPAEIFYILCISKPCSVCATTANRRNTSGVIHVFSLS